MIRSTRRYGHGGRRSYPGVADWSSVRLAEAASLPSRERRLRQAGQVTSPFGGSAQVEPAPGSAAQSAMRQFGVTA